MKRVLLSLLALGLCLNFSAYAQERVITGKVISGEDGSSPLPGVNVILKGSASTGTITDIDGNYRLTVPASASVLVFSYIGFKNQEVEIAGRTTIDVTLENDDEVLEEVVVTGVATGTSTKKLGFAVGKVGEEALQEVPATDPGNALRGKVSGVRVVQPSGNPTAAPEIRLRGSTSISGSQQPLIIIDGIITDGSLRDINMEDVESIEVIKGAAASSLYGSLAGNGVVQIITKRGTGTQGKPVLTIRNEAGFSSVLNEYPLSNTHPFALEPNGQFTLVEGNRILDPDGLHDNPYPILYDNIGEAYQPQPFMNNYVSLQASTEQFNYHLSFQNQFQAGVVENLDPYQRRNVRLNLDYAPNDKLELKLSSSYNVADGVNVTEQGQGANNLFYSFINVEPFINLAEDADGDGIADAEPTGFDIAGGNFQNPLYTADLLEFGFDRQRLIAGITLNYNLTDWLTLSGQYSIDRDDTEFFFYSPQGFQTNGPGSGQGSLLIENEMRNTEVFQASARFNKQLGDINLTMVAKYLLENRTFDGSFASGNNFSVSGVRNLAATTDQRQMGSFIQEEVAENIFFDASIDYKDKIIVSGLIRRDGSSLFGEENQYQVFGRGSFAYRITEDFTIPGVQEMKIRASYGTSGQRPVFWNSEFETFTVNSLTGALSRATLGNQELKPSVIQELEVGTNIDFLNRFFFEANYAVSNVIDDFLNVPLSGVIGFPSQWQNVGETRSTALEFSWGGNIIKKGDFSWDFTLNWDRIRQEITDLGDVPAFTRDPVSGPAINVFRVEAGLPYGTIYGNQIVTSIDQLTVNEAGFVINPYGTQPLQNGFEQNTLRPEDFTVNEDGYVVIADAVGTASEQVLYLTDESGTVDVVKIGDTNPDFNIGFSSTWAYKGLSLYFLLDYQQGGDIYNYTRQLAYFNDRHADLETSAAAGKHAFYRNGTSEIYNRGSASSEFVEDGTFAKIREISLGYTLPSSKMGRLGDYIREAKLTLSGRNLFTFTDYTGWDPEVALNGNATNFRFDEYAYPQFRTYTATLQFKF